MNNMTNPKTVAALANLILDELNNQEEDIDINDNSLRAVLEHWLYYYYLCNPGDITTVTPTPLDK